MTAQPRRRDWSRLRSTLAGVAFAAALAGAAMIAAVAAAPSSLPVPQAVSHAPGTAAHHAVVVRPSAHRGVQSRAALTVTVRPGDCLWTIARAHHVSEAALYRANRSTVGPNPNLIYPGMRLRIPLRRRTT